jgi:dTMP kinase
MQSKAKLIALEGIDAQGIKEQAESLYRWLRDLGVRVEKTREPTNGPVGTQIQLHRQQRLHFPPGSLALLLMADRLDHLTRQDGILSWLEGGRHVLCVHYLVSSYARLLDQVPFEWHRQINARCRAPDLTLYIDTGAGENYRRVTEALSAEGQALCRIDAAGDAETIHRQCQREISHLLSLGGT